MKIPDLAAAAALLAATALHHGLRLITRNERDFSFPGLEVVDPWTCRPARPRPDADGG